MLYRPTPMFLALIILAILVCSFVVGCADTYPTKVYYEIHPQPIPEMLIRNNPDGTQSIVSTGRMLSWDSL